MNVITLNDQLEWCLTCLEAMKAKGRPMREIILQESVVATIKARIVEKYGYV